MNVRLILLQFRPTDDSTSSLFLQGALRHKFPNYSSSDHLIVVAFSYDHLWLKFVKNPAYSSPGKYVGIALMGILSHLNNPTLELLKESKNSFWHIVLRVHQRLLWSPYKWTKHSTVWYIILNVYSRVFLWFLAAGLLECSWKDYSGRGGGGADDVFPISKFFSTIAALCSLGLINLGFC